MNLSTSFGGLTLRNPFIVSSCSLTARPEKNLELEKAGAGAIVLKSIFEEEIMAQVNSMDHDDVPIEGYDYVSFYQKQHCLDEYCRLIRDTKQVCSIPVIASVNCFTGTEWTAYAKMFQDAGADAIELNVMRIVSDYDYNYGTLEQQHVELLRAVKAAVTIPVIMKLGHHFTNVVPLVGRLRAEGAAAVVLFNKMCPLDFDVEKLSVRKGEVLSNGSELSEVLRWTALTSAKLPAMPLVASGGVVDGEAFVKVLLAGASAAEVCSVLYKQGVGAVTEMVACLNEWMTRHQCDTIDQVKGRLNASHRHDGDRFERIQFFSNISQAKNDLN